MKIRKNAEIKSKHILEFIALVVLGTVFRCIPMRLLYAACIPISRLMLIFDKKHSALCMKNIRLAFPEKNEMELESLRRGIFLNTIKIFFEFIRLDTFFKTKPPHPLFDVSDFAKIDPLFKQNKGVVVVTSHLGNWELEGGITCYMKYKLNAIYFPQNNPLADAYFNQMRNNVGINLIPNNMAIRKTLEHLSKNELVAFLSDQDARGGSVFVDFFGQKASTVKGPVFFALRTGAPMILACLIRLPGNKFKMKIEEIPVTRTSDFEADILSTTQLWSTMLEKIIRQYPEQWFWVHNRWNTRPEDKTS